MRESQPSFPVPATLRPWYRVTVLRLMAMVAVVALGLGIVAWMGRRSAWLRAESVRHIKEAAGAASGGPSARINFHLEMFEKYRRAASHPWLPVEPDPPEPEE